MYDATVPIIATILLKLIQIVDCSSKRRYSIENGSVSGSTNLNNEQ